MVVDASNVPGASQRCTLGLLGLGILVVVTCSGAGCDSQPTPTRAPAVKEPKAPRPAAAPSPARWVDVDPPAEPGAFAPSLETREGGVGLSWLEPIPGGDPSGDKRPLRMRYAVWKDGRWRPAVTVVEDVEFFANWVDVPGVIQGNGAGLLYAHWPEKSGPDTYAYDVRVALSRDDGQTWERLGAIHQDGTASEHGFATMNRLGSGVLALWLDGRETVRKPPGPMTLRSAVLRDGQVAERSIADPRVCDCCSVDTVAVGSTIVAVYRNRDEAEVRDIHVTRYETGGGWDQPRRLHADGWTIPGCPVNGPAIAADGNTVAVVWFTGAGQRWRIRAAVSKDGGASFGPPIELDADPADQAPLGRVDIASIGKGEFAVTWLDGLGDGAVVRLARLDQAGHRGPPMTLFETSRSRKSGVPTMVRIRDGLFVAWTSVTGDQTSIRGRRVSLSAIPPVDQTLTRQVAGVADGLRAGWQLPYYTASTLDNERKRVRTRQDRALLVNLWATWCAPCRREMPLLAELARKHGKLDVVAISIDGPDDRAAIRTWLDEQKDLGGVEVLHDPDNRASAVFGVGAVPASMLFGANGALVWFQEGELDRAAMTTLTRHVEAVVGP